jgi:hypothetical protein
MRLNFQLMTGVFKNLSVCALRTNQSSWQNNMTGRNANNMAMGAVSVQFSLH